MKFFVTILFFLFCFHWVTAQTQRISGDIIFPQSPIVQPVVERIYTGPSFPEKLSHRRLANSMIKNPGVRYVIQNLKKETYSDAKVNEAINILIQYAENERLKNVVEYLKRYAQKNMLLQTQALQTLQQQIAADSIGYLAAMTEEDDFYEYTDLHQFTRYIQGDSNFIWLRKASRDSVLLEVINMNNKSVRFWINNGQNRFHRFWASNRSGDTIGTWLQALPQGNRLKIYVDEDVYLAPALEKKSLEVPGKLANQPDDQYFTIDVPRKIPIHRRYWTYYSEVEIAMSQGKLANWASGGENSLSLLSNLRYYWNYNRNKTSWENWMHYRFGFMKNGSEEIRKNEDRFELNSKLGQKAFKHWYYTAQFNALTQLFNSYDYPKDQERKLVANFMSPGYFTLSLGMDYKPNNNFSLVISPIAGKWNFVRDTAKISASRYGISEAGKRYKREAGAQLNLFSKLNNLLNIMDINNELKIFMSYERKDKYLNAGKEDEEKKHIPLTANWKMTLSFKINYFMSASIYTETIYDENYSRKLQFRENLNLGVKFRF